MTERFKLRHRKLHVDQLLLYLERRGHGFDFHPLVWEREIEGAWTVHLAILQEKFERGTDRVRWVSNGRSLDPERGLAVLKVAEGDRPKGSFAIEFRYSWREWDLVNNRETRRLKDRAFPLQPFDS